MATTQNQRDVHGTESSVSAGTGQVQRHHEQKQGVGGMHRKHDTMHQMQDKAQNIASDAASTAKEQGEQMASKAKEKTNSFVADQQHQAASKIDDIAKATRRAADTLRQQGDETVARYTETAADQAAALSNYLRGRQPTDLLHDLEDAATRHPAAVYGGLFVAGLAISRFLKASERSPAQRSNW